MKIFGEYFACGYVHGKDCYNIYLEDIDLLKYEDLWLKIDSKIDAIGIYPDNIPFSDNYSGQKFKLDVFKLNCQNKEIFFGCVEIQICWYVFYKFKDNDLSLIKNNQN